MCQRLKLHPPAWKAVRTLKVLHETFKAGPPPIPPALDELAWRVSEYERAIRALWERSKEDIERRGKVAVHEFVDNLIELAGTHWLAGILAELGIDELTPEQEAIFDEQLNTNIAYMRDSLRPAIVERLADDFDARSLAERLVALDHRVIALYAGALWSAGSLMFAMFDGVQARDMAALFMFAGPNDASTCTGERGCDQYANRIFPLAQILAEDIIPGHLQCVTNCRHILLPIVRIPGEEEPDLSGIAEELERM